MGKDGHRTIESVNACRQNCLNYVDIEGITESMMGLNKKWEDIELQIINGLQLSNKSLLLLSSVLFLKSFLIYNTIFMMINDIFLRGTPLGILHDVRC